MAKGKDKAKKTAKKIKKEVEAEKAEADKNRESEKSLTKEEMHGMTIATEVLEHFKENAELGSDEVVRDQMPLIKVTEALSDHTTIDGQEPELGSLFYTGTREAFDELEVSILHITRGFYTESYTEGQEPQFKQIVFGLILDTMQPFAMYMHGSRLQRLWDFGKEISPFVKSKQSPIPMYAFRVNLTTTEFETRNENIINVVEFQLQRDNGKLELITDIGTLETLKKGVEKAKEAGSNIIMRNEVDKETGELLHDPDMVEAVPVTDEEVESAEDVAKDVPF